ncbi:MAG: fructose-bisphosphatase class III [Blastocatellia bacterium]|nr:fructose-bisphosphatase class III [Blastocatellia bacterium]
MSNRPVKKPSKTTTNIFDEQTLIYLRALSKEYPSIDSALAKIAYLEAVLTLPKGTIHVVSDVHGEFKKLKHIINNASGSLRPLVEQTFGDRLNEAEQRELINFIYYPRETSSHLALASADKETKGKFLRKVIRQEFEILRSLAKRYSIKAVEKVFPQHYQMLFREILFEPQLERSESYINIMLDQFVEQEKALELLRMVARVIRNLLISELIVAGDLGDRGPRIDRVVDYVMRQPNVAITWGNHDVSWMGACLGQEACIATVFRISLRYRRLSQLEEGYGIPATPLEKLVRTVYSDDPATRFSCKGEGLRDPLLMARMQKAMAIIQFKLEGQVSRRHPEYKLEERNLLHKIDPNKATVTIDGVEYPLLDTNFPTIDWSDPYKLSPEEAACIKRLRESFLLSPTLWQQMKYVEKRGSTYLRRDNNIIFHGCMPVDEQGNYLPMIIDGAEYKGKALFDAINQVVHRAFRTKEQSDLDMFWYLWTGPLSPMFGKDRMATFETYFIEDKTTHKESKNPYFKLIHNPKFCTNICKEFGISSPDGMIVNGHVPVKLEKGESPLKESGHAVTIDGAFSEAYGDKGYTLILDSSGSYLAQHHHFESVSDAITQGSDIIPTIHNVAIYEKPRQVGDTEKGDEIRQEIEVLKLLIKAYKENAISEI